MLAVTGHNSDILVAVGAVFPRPFRRLNQIDAICLALVVASLRSIEASNGEGP